MALKYEPLRDAQRLAAEQALERAQAEQPSRDSRQDEKAGPEIDREQTQVQARGEVALEQAKRYEWQKIAYEQRQRDEAANQQRSAARSENMRANNPVEYARQERDTQLRADAADRDKQIKQEWGERSQASRQGQERPGREQSDATREKGDAAQQREGNKWKAEMSERAQAAAEQSRDRSDEDRERSRSDR